VNNLSKSILKTVLVAVAVVALWCQPARAQFGMGGGDMSQWMAPVTKKAVESYAAMLGLDKDQKEAALALQDGYRSSFKQLSTDMQKAFKDLQEKAQDSGDFVAMGKEMGKLGTDFQGKMEKLEKGFLEDVKALLSDQQKEKWPRVERARRRDTGLRFGFVSGQNVDLVKMLQAVGAKTDAPPELAEQVDRYELDTDKNLQAFEKWGKEQQAKQQKMMEDGGMPDFGKIQDMMKELADMAKAQRDTNRTYAKSIGALLPPETQAKFELEIKKRSFPRVYREAYAAKAIGEAEKFNDLDADQKTAIADLKAGYARDVNAANKKWAAAIEDREEKNGGTLGAMMSGFMGGGNQDDEVGQARNARKEIDDRAKDKLLAVLKEDQKKRLPEDKPDPKDKGGMDFFNFDPPEQDPD
jgi:hypothetical protein